VVFFNNETPYSGSIIQIMDAQGISYPPLEKTEFDAPGIYYRHFQWQDSSQYIWWTLAISDIYFLILFGVLPAMWLWRRWRQRHRPFSISPSERGGLGSERTLSKGDLGSERTVTVHTLGSNEGAD
jgi:hypothetical protein